MFFFVVKCALLYAQFSLSSSLDIYQNLLKFDFITALNVFPLLVYVNQQQQNTDTRLGNDGQRLFAWPHIVYVQAKQASFQELRPELHRRYMYIYVLRKKVRLE